MLICIYLCVNHQYYYIDNFPLFRTLVVWIYRNKYDEATAPTGVVASLVDGKTRYRSIIIPASNKKFHNATIIDISNIEAKEIRMILGEIYAPIYYG